MAVRYIFEFINVILIITIDLSSSIPPKSVNLALEASFLFKPKDFKQFSAILKNSRSFLDKLDNLFSQTKYVDPTFRTRYDNNSIVSNGILTKFLTEIGGIVLNYDEEEVKMLAAALNDEIARNYVSNPHFHDMFENIALRGFIKNIVKVWTITDPITLKLEIANYIKGNEGNAFVKFFRNLNYFFENDKEKLQNLVKKFAKARKTRNFSKPLAKTFKLIFERYDKLGDLKSSLHGELDRLMEYIKVHYKQKLNQPIDSVRRSYTDQTTVSLLKKDGHFYTSFENANNNANEIKIDKDAQLSMHTLK